MVNFKNFLVKTLLPFVLPNWFLFVCGKNVITALGLVEIDPRIIGGSPINSITQAPWQVSVRLKIYEAQKFGFGHICGGSVITQRVIVSAAHCVANTAVTPMVYRNPREFTLVMGSIYLYSVTTTTQQYDVLQVFPNSLFDMTTLANDVSLFFINGYIPVDSVAVQPVPLNVLSEPSGTNCTVTGWGTTSTGFVSPVLMGATVPIVSVSTCSTNYGTLSDGMLCAGYMQSGGVDACQGDSGGPLTCNGYLAGIVSWGKGCAMPGYPGVYTNVSYFYNWIVSANSTFNYTYYVDQSGSAKGVFDYRFSLISVGFVIFVAFIFKKTLRAANLSELDSRIIGGSEIAISQAPWQVSVRLKMYDKEQFGYGHICGGTVLTVRVVVSAAHCLANTAFTPIVYRSASEFTLVMGTATLYYKAPETQQFDVTQVIRHSNFNIDTVVNDVAIFFLNGNIVWVPSTVQPISLNMWPVASGTECSVAGWGTTGAGYISQVLESATVPIVSATVCSTNYYNNIKAGMLCAGDMENGGIDACQGDSGGPLICNGLLTGIVSWGNGCALPGYPGVYTNVSYFENWISMTNSSLNYTYYISADDESDSANGIFDAKMSMLSIFSGLIFTSLLRV